MKWDENAINNHAQKMLVRAKNIWKLPKTKIVVNDNFKTLTLDDEIDFSEYIIYSFKLFGEEVDAANFLDIFKRLCSNLYALNPIKYSNYKTTYHATSSKTFKKSFEINSNLFISLDGNDASKIEYLRNITLYLGLELDDIEFTLKLKEKFDILKESTYSYARAGEFAKAAFNYLFSEKLLSNSDIQLLLDTKWTRETFPKSVYAVLSTDKMAGATEKIQKGKKYTTTRYYGDPINYNGMTLYLSSQWYPNTKDGLIAYFKKITKSNL